jgi:peptidoglycan/xylan/chitin deacetylase (PgdA/CDA1 family)
MADNATATPATSSPFRGAQYEGRTPPGIGKRLKFLARDTPGIRHAILSAKALVCKVANAPLGLHTLCYHHVAAEHQARFARQLDHFGRHGTFVGADRAIDLVRSGEAGRGRFFLLSFDDGYADTVDVALPVLTERQIPAIAFMVGAFLDKPPIDSSDRRSGFMSRVDLATWCAAGMAVGSHSHTHRRMIGLSDSEARWEFEASKAALAFAMHMPIRHFACPWGDPDHDFRPDHTPRLAAEAGFRSFFTTTRGAATAESDLLLMPRHVLEPAWGIYELDALIGGRRSRSGKAPLPRVANEVSQ